MKLRAVDTRGNSSPELQRSLSPLDLTRAPAVSSIAGTLHPSRVDLSFDISDPQGDADVVEMVFRNGVEGEIVVADTVYGSCRRTISAGNGRKSVSCPRIPGMKKGTVTVVPFDVQGNWGRVDRCAMMPSSFSCVGR
jgi:hypothetical protein